MTAFLSGSPSAPASTQASSDAYDPQYSAQIYSVVGDGASDPHFSSGLATNVYSTNVAFPPLAGSVTGFIPGLPPAWPIPAPAIIGAGRDPSSMPAVSAGQGAPVHASHASR